MKAFKFCVLMIPLFFNASKTVAQLYVGDNFVYVADHFLYVKQDVNIKNTGGLYLRNQSQLLQAKTGVSANSGNGKLSVFQEGSVNNFAYNYWCSPVGNSITASGNEPFGITMLQQPSTAILSTPANIITGYNGSANPLNISSYWIYKFLSSSQYSQWIAVCSASTIAAGEGFTMKGTSGTDASFSDSGTTNNPGSKQRYDFRGRPNDGDITINLAAGKLTLTGNPYPSAIDLKAFLLDAVNSTGVAYFWEQDKAVNSHNLTAYKGGYGTYSPIGGANVGGYGTMGVYTPAVFYAYNGSGTQLGAVGAGSNYERRFCPIGQGFMLEGATTASVTMSNLYRVYQKEGAANYSQFGRHTSNDQSVGATLPAIPSVSGFDYATVTTIPIPQIRFNTLMNNQAIRQTALAFHPAATDGADFSMDAKSPDVADMDMYFVIDNAPYVIDVVDFNINKRIPIGYKNATPASFKIVVADMIHFNEATHVYLHDKISNTYFDILQDPHEIALPAGTNNTQYEITFTNSTLGNNDVDADSFTVFQNNVTQTLTIENPKLLGIALIRLYDITGKLILDAGSVGIQQKYQFSTAMLSDAVYVVKVIAANGRDFGQKIAVYNTQ